MPAEWEPHAATWLSWPHNVESWPGRFAPIPKLFARMVAVLAASEPVHINVNDLEMEREARRHLNRAGARGEIHFHHIPTNDAWCRDHGAIFVVGKSLLATNWGYNAWGEKYPYELDDAVPEKMAAVLDVPVYDGGMILEGGSIDVNGAGMCLTTESCLLNPNRNPHLTREDIESRLCDVLGIDTVIWLDDGIAGDDTDGHIDDIARFVSKDTVVIAAEPDTADVNHRPLVENRRRLAETAPSLNVVELPMPPALVYEGQRLPATYANFFIANEAVLVPGYDAATDAIAADTLGQLFPTREIVVLDCTDLIWGLGAFHCLTQQVPKPGF